MIRKALISVFALSLTGCAAMSSNAPVTGFWYTNAKGATTATSNPMGSKTGESCAVSYLGLIAMGDASVATAAKSAGITKISAVDSNNSNILGLIAKNCTVVTGD